MEEASEFKIVELFGVSEALAGAGTTLATTDYSSPRPGFTSGSIITFGM